jgi:hypothetical protein
MYLEAKGAEVLPSFSGDRLEGRGLDSTLERDFDLGLDSTNGRDLERGLDSTELAASSCRFSIISTLSSSYSSILTLFC